MTSPRLWKTTFWLLVAAVLWLALTPQPPHAMDTGWDKLNHALAFGSLALAGRFGFPGPRGRVLALALGLLALGIGIEWLQSFVPSRSSEWRDVVADAVGIGAGLFAAALARRVLRA